ncbi:MAG TPA: DUF2064 domain-containing protein [Thermoanaerobaculia bacterium]|nr:DUF2064 domain-containing protein [Thermoanaerobaculia bacterium]
MRAAIVLFARSPEREAAAKRMPSSAPLFRSLAAAWLREAMRCGAAPVIACSARDREAFAAIAPDVPRAWIEQRGGAFGDRVAAVAEEAFARGLDAVIVAAIDAPPRELDRALRALSRGVAVVSPSRDGGINYIGLLAPERELLRRLAPRRRDLVRVCAGYFARLEVVGGAVDLDSRDGLAVVGRDRAWRAYVGVPLTLALSPRGGERGLIGFSFPHRSRPPPL